MSLKRAKVMAGSWKADNPYKDPHLDAYSGAAAFDEGCIAQAKALIVWGEEDCPHCQVLKIGRTPHIPRRLCDICWQQLKQEVECG